MIQSCVSKFCCLILSICIITFITFQYVIIQNIFHHSTNPKTYKPSNKANVPTVGEDDWTKLDVNLLCQGLYLNSLKKF